MGSELREKKIKIVLTSIGVKQMCLWEILKSTVETHGFAKYSLNTTGVENFTAGRRGDQSKILLFFLGGGHKFLGPGRPND